MKTEEIISGSNKYLTPNYGRSSIALVKGRKSAVWDANGKKYLDFVSGLAVNNLGHNFAPVNKAMQKQMGKLAHVSNLYHIEAQVEYAKALVGEMGKGKVFFCNSGTEANEAALKLARLHFSQKGETGKTEIISFNGSFHGRTMGSLALTGQKKFKKGFGTMLSSVKHVPYNDIAAVEKAISEKTCAVIVESIQGEVGVCVPGGMFLSQLAKLCHKSNVLLIIDEVQTGFGRTGKLFCYEHFKIKPDIVTMAKGIANGFPMGAMFARGTLGDSLVPGSHAATFGGNPVACAGALAVLKEILKPELVDNVRNLGRYMALKLTGMKSSAKKIKEVRGLGLMIGVELNEPGAGVVSACAEKGLLINCANENTIRFLPPLIVTKEEVDKALVIFSKIIGA